MENEFDSYAQNLGWEPKEKTRRLQESNWGTNFEYFALRILGEFMQSYRFKAGTTIFREDDPGFFMAFVVDGAVKVLKEGDDGYDHAIAEIKAGTALGEMALVDGGNRSATIIANRETDMLILTKSSFEALSEEYPPSLGFGLIQAGSAPKLPTAANQR